MDDAINFKFFSNTATVLEYARAAVKIGLWASEKIIFEKAIPKDAEILELGAGAGRVSLGLSTLGYQRLTVTDFAPAMVEIAEGVFAECARTSPPPAFCVEDATALSFPDAKFDAVIFAFNGLQMIPKQSRRIQAISEISRVLKDGGVFIFTGHDRTHPARKQYWEAEYSRRKDGNHNPELEELGDLIYTTPHGNIFIHAAIPDEMQTALENAGFEIGFSELRSRICEESAAVLDFSDDTRFWVARKRGNNT